MKHDHHQRDGKPKGIADKGDTLPADPGCELIVLARYNDIPDAELARGELEANGIQSVIFDENTINAQWLYAQAMGGMRLMVRARDASTAAEILGLPPISAGELAQEAGETEEAKCPKCGNGDVKTGFFTVYGTSFLGIIGILLFYILPAIMISEAILAAIPWGYRCKACGHKWRKLKAAKPTP